jgi:hypothetical protein
MEPQYLTDKEALLDALNKGDADIWNKYISEKRQSLRNKFGPQYEYYADLEDFKYDGGGKFIKGTLDLTKSYFKDSEISNITFEKLLMECTASSSLLLKNVIMTNSSLDNGVIINSELDTIDISGANLFGADLTNTNLKNIKLNNNTNLKNVYFGNLDIEELKDIDNLGISVERALEEKVSAAKRLYPNIDENFLKEFFTDNTTAEIAMTQAKHQVNPISYEPEYTRPMINFDFGVGFLGAGLNRIETANKGYARTTSVEERTNVTAILYGPPDDPNPLIASLPNQSIVNVSESAQTTLSNSKESSNALNTDLYADLNLVLTKKLGLNAGANHSLNDFAARTGIHAGLNFNPTENFSLTGGVEKSFLNYKVNGIGSPGPDGTFNNYDTSGYNLRLASAYETNNFKGTFSASIPLNNTYSDLGKNQNTDYTDQYFFSKIPTALNLDAAYKFKNGLSLGLYASLNVGAMLSYSTTQPEYLGSEVNTYSFRDTETNYYTEQQLSELFPGQEFPYGQEQLTSSFDNTTTKTTETYFNGKDVNINQFAVGFRVAFDFGAKKPGGVGRK